MESAEQIEHSLAQDPKGSSRHGYEMTYQSETPALWQSCTSWYVSSDVFDALRALQIHDGGIVLHMYES